MGMKKLLCIVFLIIVTVGCLSVQTSAAEVIDSGYCGSENTDLIWTLYNDGTLTILGSGDMKNYTYFNHAPWFDNRRLVKEIVIENDVTSIGNYAFDTCYNLTSITIPDSITSIGEHAFYYCRSLNELTLPDSVSRIGDCAFSECYNLSSMIIPDRVTAIGSGTFYKCNKLTSIIIPNSVTIIGSSAFSQSGLRSVTIGDSVTNIGDSAFYYCEGLSSVTIPDNVAVIGGLAFGYCSNLTSVTVGRGVMNVDYWAFYQCDDLNAVYFRGDAPTVVPVDDSSHSFPSTTTLYYRPETAGWTESEAYDTSAHKWNGYALVPWGNYCGGEGDGINLQWELDSDGTLTIFGIGAMADYGPIPSPWDANKNDIRKILIEEGVTTIGEAAFLRCSNLTTVIASNGVTSIGDAAFACCTELATLALPDSLTTIGRDAFGFCNSLTEVTIPNNVKDIGDNAFYSCDSLTSVVIPNNVTSIGGSAFSCCRDLSVVTLGKHLERIGDFAFRSCDKLSAVYFKGSAPEIGSDIFEQDVSTIYYTPGTIGWVDSDIYDAEMGTWNGYLLKIWEHESFINTPAIEKINVTGERAIECSLKAEVLSKPESPLFTKTLVGIYEATTGKFVGAATGEYDGDTNVMAIYFDVDLSENYLIRVFCLDDDFVPVYKVSEFRVES